MASISLGSSNLWNLKATTANLTQKVKVEDSNGESANTPTLQTPIAEGGGNLVKVDNATILANNGVTISTQNKSVDYKNEDAFAEDFAQGKYKDGQTGTIDGRQYIIKDNAMYYLD